jgi:hypothetical protein
MATAYDLREEVRRRFAESARAVADGASACGCGDGPCCGDEQISVEFTHEVAHGMHAAIVKAVKKRELEPKGLPVIEAAAQSGCC